MSEMKRDARHVIQVTLNGEKRSGFAQPRMLLSDFIRHELGATGTHVGCEHGVCGACTIQLDGRAIRSCLTLAVQADGCDLVTVEGLTQREAELSLLQRAMKRHHALQCGYCTPGILMSFDVLMRKNPKASDQDIIDVLAGHLCRCTGYANITSAMRDVLDQIKSNAGGDHV
ncbi:MAG: (2Fe-2S)-binding protein [Alphaproteobacteria bacterium]|nr:(2Fe-2S)-binding protein [Alphaproteobacteria bacterium]